MSNRAASLITITGPLLLIAASASARPFYISAVDSGVLPGTLGNPITWTHPTNGAPYNSPVLGGPFGPSADLCDAIPAARYDSYLALDSIGPTDPGTAASGDGYNTNVALSANPSNSGFSSSGGAGMTIGTWVNPGFVISTDNPAFGMLDTIFLLNLTLRAGSSVPTTDGLRVNIKEQAQGTNSVAGPVRFGQANASNNNNAWARRYYLDYVAIDTGTTLPTAFTGATNYAIYLVQDVPAPGASGIFGCIGIAAARRRRTAQ